MKTSSRCGSREVGSDRLPVYADLESGALYVEAATYEVPPQETVQAFLDQVSTDDLEECIANLHPMPLGQAIVQSLREMTQ